jgi:hypothetical protein
VLSVYTLYIGLIVYWFMQVQFALYGSANTCRRASPHLWCLTFGVLSVTYLHLYRVVGPSLTSVHPSTCDEPGADDLPTYLPRPPLFCRNLAWTRGCLMCRAAVQHISDSFASPSTWMRQVRNKMRAGGGSEEEAGGEDPRGRV